MILQRVSMLIRYYGFIIWEYNIILIYFQFDILYEYAKTILYEKYINTISAKYANMISYYKYDNTYCIKNILIQHGITVLEYFWYIIMLISIILVC